jgi:hypothetical protein
MSGRLDTVENLRGYGILPGPGTVAAYYTVFCTPVACPFSIALGQVRTIQFRKNDHQNGPWIFSDGIGHTLSSLVAAYSPSWGRRF